ncbi:hypothetical protein V5O48_013934, partial [Marasmius crinis-equi]
MTPEPEIPEILLETPPLLPEQSNPNAARQPISDSTLDAARELSNPKKCKKRAENLGEVERLTKRPRKVKLEEVDSNTLQSIAREEGFRHYKPTTNASNENKVPLSELRKSAASTGYIRKPQAPLPEMREYNFDKLYQD